MIQINTLNEGGEITEDLQAEIDRKAKIIAEAKRKYNKLATRYNAQGKELTKKIKAAFDKSYREEY